MMSNQIGRLSAKLQLPYSKMIVINSKEDQAIRKWLLPVMSIQEIIEGLILIKIYEKWVLHSDKNPIILTSFIIFDDNLQIINELIIILK